MTVLIWASWTTAIAAAIAYLPLTHSDSTGLPRALLKTLPVALFALIACLSGSSGLLVLAFVLSAFGDFALARTNGTEDRPAWFLAGLTSFLLAHVVFVAEFWRAGADVTWLTILLPVALGAVQMLRLWSRLGPMRLPVLAYVAVISVMGALGLGFYAAAPLLAAGVALFIISDLLLSERLFTDPQAGKRRLLNIGVWSIYVSGQALILAGATAAI